MLEMKSPNAIEIPSNITFKKACNVLDKQGLVSKFRVTLEDVISKINVLVDITIKEIQVSCSEKAIWLPEGRSKTIKMDFTLLLNLSVNQISSERVVSPKRTVDAIKRFLLQNVNQGTFTLSVHGTKIKAETDSYKGTEVAVCSPGEGTRSYYCGMLTVNIS